MTQIEMDAARAQIRTARAVEGMLEVDWDQRRYELSKSAMNGILSNTDAINQYADESFRMVGSITECVAKAAVAYADAVIKELKKSRDELV